MRMVRRITLYIVLVLLAGFVSVVVAYGAFSVGAASTLAQWIGLGVLIVCLLAITYFMEFRRSWTPTEQVQQNVRRPSPIQEEDDSKNGSSALYWKQHHVERVSSGRVEIIRSHGRRWTVLNTVPLSSKTVDHPELDQFASAGVLGSV
jgi:membrane protein implicated in regulation of membrane protease activity